MAIAENPDNEALGAAINTMIYDQGYDKNPKRVVSTVARQYAGLSKIEMAERMGCSRWTIARIEEGKHRFPPAKAQLWAEICDIPYSMIEHEVNW